MKTLTAHEQSLSRIFGDDYAFSIPPYQRPYAWTTEQARELIDDLLWSVQAEPGPIEKTSPYFLGSIVLIKVESLPPADVVDGQQRLTTLTILLAAIRANLPADRASDVTPLLYEKGNAIKGTKDRFRLQLRERDREFFQRYVQREDGFQALLELTPETDSQKNIQENARLLNERVMELTERQRLDLAQFIVTRCYLVVVSTPDLDAAYRIFSVLNSRGLDLAPTDILKADVIGAIPESQRAGYTTRWEDIEEELGREAFAELFSHIRMVYRKSKPKGTLIKEFKEHVTALASPIGFMENVLEPMTRAFQQITDAAYDGTATSKDVNEHLKWLNRLEFNDWVPPAIAFVTRHRSNPSAILQFVRDLERLAYGLLITGRSINVRIERFSRITGEIEAAADLSAEQSALQLSAKEQREVYAELDGAVYENFAPRARTAILLRLDSLLSGGGATYDYPVISVEHVLPQSPKAGSDWLMLFPDAEQRAGWVHRLGNLALLTRRKNSAAFNYEFPVKKATYFARDGVSPFVLTTQVLSEDTWTPTTLSQRQRILMSALQKHWRLQSTP